MRELRAADRYLICSDGLSPVVSAGAIRDALASAATPAEAVRQLTALAEEAGGPDNITVVVVDVRASRPGILILRSRLRSARRPAGPLPV